MPCVFKTPSKNGICSMPCLLKGVLSLPYMAIISIIPLYGTLRGEAVKEFKAMDDIGVVMTPFGDVVTVSLVANNYVVGFFPLNSGVVEVY